MSANPNFGRIFNVRSYKYKGRNVMWSNAFEACRADNVLRQQWYFWWHNARANMFPYIRGSIKTHKGARKHECAGKNVIQNVVDTTVLINDAAILFLCLLFKHDNLCGLLRIVSMVYINTY